MDIKITNTVDPGRFSEAMAKNEEYLFLKSRYVFLNDHFGLRPGCMHIVLGTTGSGKSTLVMSLVDEILAARKKVLFYSCEETIADFETKFGYAAAEFNYEHLRIFHESKMLELVNNDTENINEFTKQLELAIIETKPDVFIFDNITTSHFYDQNKEAGSTAKKIKQLCDSYQIPFVVVAHTAEKVKEGNFFDSSCIRGFRTITNTAQYVYCYMRLREEFMGKEIIVNAIYTDKSRNHSTASKACYRLNFDSSKRMFGGDYRITYGDFKKLFRGK